MSELLFFVLGMIIGGLLMTTMMCCFQINRVNELERLIVLQDRDRNEDEEEKTEVVKCEVVQ